MTIKDILMITGGNTKVIIYGVNSEDQYMKLWKGIVDDIEFANVPFGYYDVNHLTVINDEDNLVLQFDYPILSKEHSDMIRELSVGYPYPTRWIEFLYIKYRNVEKVVEILDKDKETVYNEIKVIEYL